jgi:prepilin-type N-terminal cleavage/methylation domain-containing protein
MRYAIQKKRCEKYRKGFTLLEMMIVLSLVIVLTSVTAVYNKGIGRQIVVAQQHAKVLGMIVKARSAGFTIPKTVESICGYGVHVDPVTRTFVFFKDICGSAQPNKYDEGEKIEQIVLDSSVTVASDMSDIVFIPPFGKVSIDDTDARITATVTIASASESMTKQVKVNSYGQITE